MSCALSFGLGGDRVLVLLLLLLRSRLRLRLPVELRWLLLHGLRTDRPKAPGGLWPPCGARSRTLSSSRMGREVLLSLLRALRGLGSLDLDLEGLGLLGLLWRPWPEVLTLVDLLPALSPSFSLSLVLPR